MGGQVQPLQQGRPAGGGVRGAGEPQGKQVGGGERSTGVRGVLPLHGGACPEQGLAEYLRIHALHPQLALLAGGALAPFLAVDVGDIGVLDLLRRDGPLEEVADEKTCPVGVGENDEPPLGGQSAKQVQFLTVLEDGKAGGLQNHPVHNLGQGILIIPALHHDGFPDPQHGMAFLPAASSMSRPQSSSRSWP